MFIDQSKKCCQGQKCIHLFLDSEAYHEQMGSDGSLDMAYPMHTLEALSDALFRPSTQRNWPWDRKLTLSCWCLRWFLGLRADVWKILLQVYTRPVVTQVWIEKMFNKNIKIGFRMQVVTSVSERYGHYCEMIETRTQRPLFRARKNRQNRCSTYNLVLSLGC